MVSAIDIMLLTDISLVSMMLPPDCNAARMASSSISELTLAAGDSNPNV